jgi:hypothetical protein
MRTVNLLLAFSCAAGGQTGRQLISGSASTGSAAFRYEAMLEPATPDLSGRFGGGVIAGKGIHRYMTERESRTYFGYDLLLEPLPEPNSYRASVRPLSIGADRLQLKDAAAWNQAPLPGYPEARAVRGGDTIAVDLLVNAATGQKIVDYIHIQDQKRAVYTASGVAREFTIEDVELRLMDPRVSVNGKLLEATAGHTGGVAGAAVWFYLPERGRYFLSLFPHTRRGFQKAGEIRGSTLNFTTGGERITVECNGRIAPGDAAYVLFVLHQPEWRPKDRVSRGAFLLTAGDRLDLMLRK